MVKSCKNSDWQNGIFGDLGIFLLKSIYLLNFLSSFFETRISRIQFVKIRAIRVKIFHASFPYFRISGHIHATASTTRIVPMPRVPGDKTAAGPAPFPNTVGDANLPAKIPERKPPGSFDVPIKKLLTAETRPR